MTDRIVVCLGCKTKLNVGPNALKTRTFSCPRCGKHMAMKAPVNAPATRAEAPRSSSISFQDLDDLTPLPKPLQPARSQRKNPRVNSTNTIVAASIIGLSIIVTGGVLAWSLQSNHDDGAGVGIAAVPDTSDPRSLAPVPTFASTAEPDPTMKQSVDQTASLPPSVAKPTSSPHASQPIADSPVVVPAPSTSSGINQTRDAGAAGKLTYAWKSGDTRVYEFAISSRVGDGTSKLTGNCTFDFQSSQSRSNEDPEDAVGTGSGFVVTQDGYIVTCAHVVEGTDDVEVALGKRKYKANTIAIDSTNDLAVIKIDGRNLQALPLGNSDNIRLAEDVRAFGFPLSSILGDGVKVTRGTISGIEQDANAKHFQIDAAINPGNSGGPLIDMRGNVVGINSAKLSGSPISLIGFSVPSNLAVKLLHANGIRPNSTPRGTERSGPELAREVLPAVALITVRTTKQTVKLVKLKYSSNYSVQTQAGQDSNNGSRSASINATPAYDSKRESGTVTIDQYGMIRDNDQSDTSPSSAGSMALMVFHPLDSAGKKQWDYERRTMIVNPESQQQGSRIPGGFPSGFGPSRTGRTFGIQNESQPQMMEGVERNRYRILSDDGNVVRIAHSSELRSIDKPDDPIFSLHGSGEIVFDRRLGLSTTMTTTMMLESRFEGRKIAIPLEISYRLRDPAEVEQARRDALAVAERKAKELQQIEASELAMEPARRARFYYAEAVSGNRAYLNKLAKMEPVSSEQQEIAAYLMQEARKNPRQQSLVMAAGQWATPRELTIFVQMLDGASERNWPATRSIMRAIRHHKDERTIKPLIRLLQGGHTVNRDAAQSLIAMGPMAEDAVLDLIDTDSRRAVVNVLAEIGTKKSANEIRRQITKFDTFGRRDAINAIQKIEQRY